MTTRTQLEFRAVEQFESILEKALRIQSEVIDLELIEGDLAICYRFSDCTAHSAPLKGAIGGEIALLLLHRLGGRTIGGMSWTINQKLVRLQIEQYEHPGGIVLRLKFQETKGT